MAENVTSLQGIGHVENRHWVVGCRVGPVIRRKQIIIFIRKDGVASSSFFMKMIRA